jgi:hypothetical protein
MAAAGGAGVKVGVAGPVSLRMRAALQLNDVRASVVQPNTGRTDAGNRWLPGVGADVAVVVQVSPGITLEAGVHAAWLGDATTVQVHNQPVATIAAWTEGIALGVGARFH